MVPTRGGKAWYWGTAKGPDRSVRVGIRDPLIAEGGFVTMRLSSDFISIRNTVADWRPASDTKRDEAVAGYVEQPACCRRARTDRRSKKIDLNPAVTPTPEAWYSV